MQSSNMQLDEGGASWPVVDGSYSVGDPTAPIAVCALTSDELIQPLAQVPGVAIAGEVQTANLGIERIILNVTGNPSIRFLLLCGKESRLFGPGQTLGALFDNKSWQVAACRAARDVSIDGKGGPVTRAQKPAAAHVQLARAVRTQCRTGKQSVALAKDEKAAGVTKLAVDPIVRIIAHRPGLSTARSSPPQCSDPRANSARFHHGSLAARTWSASCPSADSSC